MFKKSDGDETENEFKMCFDGMHGVSGPYAEKIFGEMLAADSEDKV